MNSYLMVDVSLELFARVRLDLVVSHKLAYKLIYSLLPYCQCTISLVRKYPTTSVAPAFFRSVPNVCAVYPVVMRSSMKRIFLPFIFSRKVGLREYSSRTEDLSAFVRRDWCDENIFF